MKFKELTLNAWDQKYIDEFLKKNPRFADAEILNEPFKNIFDKDYEFSEDQAWMVSIKTKMYSVIINHGDRNWYGRPRIPGVKFKRYYPDGAKIRRRRKHEYNVLPTWRSVSNVELNLKNDCQIWTIAKCLNIEFKQSHDILVKNGWTEKHPGNHRARNWKGIFEDHGYEMKMVWRKNTFLNSPEPMELNIKGTTLSRVQRYLEAKGTYVITVKNHILCVVDGVIYDSAFCPGARVTAIYKISNKDLEL